MAGIEGWPTIEQSKNLVDQIIDYSNHEFRVYNILGGEPVLWKHFGELCKYIKENDSNSVIQVLTNGSRTLRWWEQHSEYIDKVVISHHAHTSDPVHVKRVTEICQAFNQVSIQVLMDQYNFNQCKAHFDMFIRELPGISVTPKKAETTLGSGEWMPYTQEQLDWFIDAINKSKQNTTRPRNIKRRPLNIPDRTFYASDDLESWPTNNKELIINDLNHFKGWKCNIGLDMISIKSNGDITPSSACFQSILLGNYRKNKPIIWPSDPQVCEYDSCFCGADIEVTKYK